MEVSSELRFWIWDVVVPLVTWLLTVYFAWKSYHLEKKNSFYWKWYLQNMVSLDGKKDYVYISFLNYSNVIWYILEFYIEVSYFSFKDKIKKIFGKKHKYLFFFTQEWLIVPWLQNQDLLPWTIEPRKSRWMFLYHDKFVDDTNRELIEINAKIKNFIFKDSTWKLYKYKLKKGDCPWLIISRKDYKEYKKKS